MANYPLINLNGLQQVQDEVEFKHVTDPSEDCEASISYNLQHVLMVMIQKITGHKTHEIFNNMSTIIADMQKDFDMDFRKKTLCREWNDIHREWTYSYRIGKNKKKLVTYPGTDIKFYIVLKCEYNGDKVRRRWGDSHKYIHGKYVKDPKENTNYVEVSVYVPQKKIVFTEDTMAKVLMEGDLLDVSDDLEEAELKDSTPKRKKETTTDSKSKKKKGRK
jgi:hypothetical protein